MNRCLRCGEAVMETEWPGQVVDWHCGECGSWKKVWPEGHDMYWVPMRALGFARRVVVPQGCLFVVLEESG